MRQGKTFAEYIGGHLRRTPPPARERSPYGVPGINSETDAAFILDAMGRAKREPVEQPKAKPRPRAERIAGLHKRIGELKAMIAEIGRQL